MPKVYVVNDMRHSFDKATAFGELVYATSGQVPIFRTDAVSDILEESLKDFDVDRDYLLLSGHSLLCIMAVVAIRRRFPKGATVKFLVFDAKMQDYVVRHISI